MNAIQQGGEPGDRDTLDFCEENSRSIEVLYENKEGEKVLTTVTFPYDRAVSGSEQSAFCVL